MFHRAVLRLRLLRVLLVSVVVVFALGAQTASASTGTTWTSRTSIIDNSWVSVTYGNGLFVAVAISGTGDRVMTSPDGITWTSRASAADNGWYSVTYANGLFVAVAASGTGDRVMTSGVLTEVSAPVSAPVWVPAPARAGYCAAKGNTTLAGEAIAPGSFLDLLFEQPATDTHYTGATIAIFVQGKGITCDPPPVGYALQGKASGADHVPDDLYPYYKR